jgi:hypothetical protein
VWRRWPPAKRLEFEITEGLLTDDTEEVFGKLNWLLSLVSGSSWDDFDTSYPSFSYFARFVFHKIKMANSDMRPWRMGVCGFVLTTRRICGAARLPVAARRCFSRR